MQSLVKDIYNKSGINGRVEPGCSNWNLKRSEPNPWELATRYARVGKKEEALYWLEKYFDNRPSSLPRINNNPELEILRSEPRFQEMIKKLGLSEYQTIK